MTYRVHIGDCLASLRQMPDQSVHTCVTSPPYFGLRDYGHEGQIGLEDTPDAFVARLVEVFREVRRVLRDDGTLWLNLGDSYAGGGTIGRNDTTPEALARRAQRYGTGTGAGSAVGASGARKPVEGLKPKDLLGIPWRVAFALQADGWYLRQDIIWHKPNPMPESVKDRCTKAHEYVFLLSKSARYYFDADAIRQQPSGRADPIRGFGKAPDRQDNGRSFSLDGTKGANKRSVWSVSAKPFKGAHFATFPPDLIEPCILAGAPAGGVVLDPFGGSGTTAGVAVKHGRSAVLCELNPAYAAMIPARVAAIAGSLFAGAAE